MIFGLISGLLLQEFTEANYFVKNAQKGGHDVVLEVLDPDSERGAWLAPFVMLSQIFMSLLKMLIVPLVLSSIVTGVASISGGKEFGRLGFKTLAYYMTTSLFAIFTGLLMINIFQPGTGAALNLSLPENYFPNKKEEYMNPMQLLYFQEKLFERRRELIDQSQETLHNLKTEIRDVSDDAERASRESDNILELRTRDRYRKLLSKIDSALRRIDDGSYGYCEETGEEIGLGRLDARPTATLTVDAQERREMLQRQFRDDR